MDSQRLEQSSVALSARKIKAYLVGCLMNEVLKREKSQTLFKVGLPPLYSVLAIECPLLWSGGRPDVVNTPYQERFSLLANCIMTGQHCCLEASTGGDCLPTCSQDAQRLVGKERRKVSSEKLVL